MKKTKTRENRVNFHSKFLYLSLKTVFMCFVFFLIFSAWQSSTVRVHSGRSRRLCVINSDHEVEDEIPEILEISIPPLHFQCNLPTSVWRKIRNYLSRYDIRNWGMTDFFFHELCEETPENGKKTNKTKLDFNLAKSAGFPLAVPVVCSWYLVKESRRS